MIGFNVDGKTFCGEEIKTKTNKGSIITVAVPEKLWPWTDWNYPKGGRLVLSRNFIISVNGKKV